jgi:orotate phosphoribosyltransferase
MLKMLIDRKALKFGDFVLKGGRKSPIFFNIFNAIDDPRGITQVTRKYTEILIDIINQRNKQIFLLGAAYKGIPLVPLIAKALYYDYGLNEHNFDIRWGYDRKEAKTHGEKTENSDAEKLIDGNIKEGDWIFIIDDVITEGTEKLELIDKLNAFLLAKKLYNITIGGIVVFIDRMEGATELRNQYSIYSAYKINDLAKEAFDKSLINETDYNRFVEYFNEYGLPNNT